jgi:hypothetical protein
MAQHETVLMNDISGRDLFLFFDKWWLILVHDLTREGLATLTDGSSHKLLSTATPGVGVTISYERIDADVQVIIDSTETSPLVLNFRDDLTLSIRLREFRQTLAILLHITDRKFLS